MVRTVYLHHVGLSLSANNRNPIVLAYLSEVTSDVGEAAHSWYGGSQCYKDTGPISSPDPLTLTWGFCTSYRVATALLGTLAILQDGRMMDDGWWREESQRHKTALSDNQENLCFCFKLHLFLFKQPKLGHMFTQSYRGTCRAEYFSVGIDIPRFY